MMKRFVYGEHRILLFFSPSANTVDSSWRSYNIFFKILRYTSSENTVEIHSMRSHNAALIYSVFIRSIPQNFGDSSPNEKICMW